MDGSGQARYLSKPCGAYLLQTAFISGWPSSSTSGDTSLIDSSATLGSLVSWTVLSKDLSLAIDVAPRWSCQYYWTPFTLSHQANILIHHFVLIHLHPMLQDRGFFEYATRLLDDYCNVPRISTVQALYCYWWLCAANMVCWKDYGYGKHSIIRVLDMAVPWSGRSLPLWVTHRHFVWLKTWDRVEHLIVSIVHSRIKKIASMDFGAGLLWISHVTPLPRDFQDSMDTFTDKVWYITWKKHIIVKV